MGRGIRKITVVGVGTPPPLPVRPLVDEVLRAFGCKAEGTGPLRRRSRNRRSGPTNQEPRVMGSAIAGARRAVKPVRRLDPRSLRPSPRTRRAIR